MLKAIFFFFYYTLYSTSDFAYLARSNSVRAMIKAGLKMDFEECMRELKEVVKEFGSNYENHYDKLLLRIPREKYTDAKPAIIVAAGVVAYHQIKNEEIRPFEEVIKVLRQLSQTSLIIGVITSGLTNKQSEKLVRMNLHHYFHPKAIFITEEVGIWKPNPKLYSTACRRIGLPCEDCMYIGDRPLHDIDPANSVGMITVHIQRSGRYSMAEGKTRPDHTIQTMSELFDILNKNYNIKI